jgi:hypothetical protein
MTLGPGAQPGYLTLSSLDLGMVWSLVSAAFVSRYGNGYDNSDDTTI